MAKHKGKDVEVLQEIPGNTEDKVLVRNRDGTRELLNKKDLQMEHTQHLSKHTPPKVVKDTTLKDTKEHGKDHGKDNAKSSPAPKENHLNRL